MNGELGLKIDGRGNIEHRMQLVPQSSLGSPAQYIRRTRAGIPTKPKNTFFFQIFKFSFLRYSSRRSFEGSFGGFFGDFFGGLFGGLFEGF